DHSEQAVLLRELRKSEGSTSAVDVRVESRRRSRRREYDARARVRSQQSQFVPELEVQLRHRAVRGNLQGRAGQAVPREERLQRQQPEQSDVPLQHAQLEHAGDCLRLAVARKSERPVAEHRQLPELCKLKLLESRENSIRDRGVELSARQQLVE